MSLPMLIAISVGSNQFCVTEPRDISCTIGPFRPAAQESEERALAMPMSATTSTKADVVVKPLKPKPKPPAKGKEKEAKGKKKAKKAEVKPPKAAAFFLKGVRLDTNSASSDSENQLDDDKSESPATLGNDILCKLKKYDAKWFRDVALHHPQYFVDTRQYVLFARSSVAYGEASRP